MPDDLPGFEFYPTPDEVDAWLDGIWEEGNALAFQAELLEARGFTKALGVNHLRGCRYVRFAPEGGDPFYGYWQPAPSGPAPLLVHVPGYGAEISAHPDLVMAGFNVLHINPLGYVTPEGPSDKNVDGFPPVFPDTLESGGRRGYAQWLAECVLAIRWAQAQPQVLLDRLSFFGTSQGGAMSIVLGSLYRDRGVRCVAADEPGLVDIPLTMWNGYEPALAPIFGSLESSDDPKRAWHAAGLLDGLSHARRLAVPTLLTAGSKDTCCLAEGIEGLFGQLPSTRCFCLLDGQDHNYTQPFITLAMAWFRMYA